jgi:hypothetical protein
VLTSLAVAVGLSLGAAAPPPIATTVDCSATAVAIGVPLHGPDRATDRHVSPVVAEPVGAGPVQQPDGSPTVSTTTRRPPAGMPPTTIGSRAPPAR